MKVIKSTNGYDILVDDENYQYLNQFKWVATQKSKRYSTKYAIRRIYITRLRYKISQMHREVLSCPTKKIIDHINHNGLDNRKINLRICTRSQNLMNTKNLLPSHNKTGYRGVRLHTHPNKFTAQIQIQGKQKYLGTFMSAKEAAKAYNKIAKKYFKEFAALNKV